MTDHPKPAPAREQTIEEIASERDECGRIDERIRGGLSNVRAKMLEVAKDFYQFDGRLGYRILGYDRLEDWLETLPIQMSRRTYYRIVREYRSLVVNRKVSVPTLAQLDGSKVDLVLPAIESGKTSAKDALQDAGTLTVRQLREKYAGKAAEPAQEPAGGYEARNGAPAPAVDGDERRAEPSDDQEGTFTKGTFTEEPQSSTEHIDAALEQIADAVVDVTVEGTTAAVRVTKWGEDDDVRLTIGGEVVEFDRKAVRRLVSALLRAVGS